VKTTLSAEHSSFRGESEILVYAIVIALTYRIMFKLGFILA